MKKSIGLIVCACLVIAVVVVLVINKNSCNSETNNKEEATKAYTTLAELQDKKIGFVLSAVTDAIAQEHFPNATYVQYNEQMDAIGALQTGSIDAAMVSEPTGFLCQKNIPELTLIAEPVSNTQAGVGIKKGNEELLTAVNECIAELKSDGTLDEMIGRWYNEENTTYEMPEIVLPEEGEPLIIGVAADREPSCFLDSNGNVIGLDSELAYRIAAHMNRPIEFVDMKVASFASAVDSGKVDMVISNFIISDALKDMIDFSDPYFDTPFVMVVKKGN